MKKKQIINNGSINKGHKKWSLKLIKHVTDTGKVLLVCAVSRGSRELPAFEFSLPNKIRQYFKVCHLQSSVTRA